MIVMISRHRLAWSELGVNAFYVVGAVGGALAVGTLITQLSAGFDALVWMALGVAVFALVVSLWGTGRVSFLSASTLFLLLYVTLIHIGAVVFYVRLPSENRNFLQMSTVALACFGIGQLLVASGQRAMGQRVPKRKRIVHNDFDFGNRAAWRLFAVLGVLGAALFVTGGVLRSRSLPLLDIFASYDDVRHFAELRSTFNQGGGGYLYQLYAVILPVTTLAFLLRSFVTQDNRHRRTAVFLTGVSIVALAAAGYRGELMRFFLLLGIGLSYYHGTLWTPWSRRLAAVAAVSFVGLSSGVFTSSTTGSVRETAVNRVFSIQALGPQYVYDRYQDRSDFAHGRLLIQDFKGVLPGRQLGFSSVLPGLRHTRSLNNPIGSTADVYVNFGPVGVVIYMGFFGALVQVIHSRIDRGRRSVTQLALGAGLTTAIGYSAIAGIAGSVLQYGLVTVGLMSTVVYLLAFRGRRFSLP